MSQHISATARCAYTPHFPIQLIYSSYNVTAECLITWRNSFPLNSWVCKDSHWTVSAMPCWWLSPNKADAAVHGWLTHMVIHTCARWLSHHDAGVTCVLLDFALFSTSNQRKCRHKNNSLTCSLRADRFWLRLFGCVYVWVGWKNVGCQSSIL